MGAGAQADRRDTPRRAATLRARDPQLRERVCQWALVWHLDFHFGSKKVLVVRGGEYVTPVVLGILDDHSRLACHLQWYFNPESAP